MTDPQTTQHCQILVTGDVAIDSFEYCLPPEGGELLNWRKRPRVERDLIGGGALLLAEACRAALPRSDVIGPVMSAIPPGQDCPAILRSEAEVAQIGGRGPYFLDRYRGYSLQKVSEQPILPRDSSGAQVVLVDDAGNGFRDRVDLFPSPLSPGVTVVTKICAPLATGRWWDYMLLESTSGVPSDGPPHARVAVVSGNDLREIAEVAISRALSWERTARDFTFQIALNSSLRALARVPYLVVLLGLDGALIHRGFGHPETDLVFDPMRLEGDFAREIGRAGVGANTAFTAALAARLAREGMCGLVDGVKDGLWAARRASVQGLKLEGGALRHDFEGIGSAHPTGLMLPEGKKLATRPFACVRVPQPTKVLEADPESWTILDAQTAKKRLLIATELARTGKHPLMNQVPEISFGPKLKTFDRQEIESYSSIRKLIEEYICLEKPEQPLCIAVFGAPGSGKSFGVKQIAKVIGADLEPMTFNVSQFKDYEDLVAALHQVRNQNLRGTLPLVFFDELDSDRDGVKLGWLKAFLAPMQDACFRDGDVEHAIGKAIFVFAGGTCSSFEEFFPRDMDPESNAGKALKDAKVPDFVSRLRGRIDILGPNQRNDGDEAYVLRRARILHLNLDLLKKTKTAGLFDAKTGEIRIDPGVLRALLRVPRLRHGHRSIQALIDMSQLSGRKVFDQAALPPRNQLALHVDPAVFENLLSRECFSTDPVENHALGERLGRAIHEDYVKQRKAEGKTLKVAERFEDLSLEKRTSNIDAALDIPHKLMAIRVGLRRLSTDQRPRTFILSHQEVEILAMMEHERWMRQERAQGTIWGPQADLAIRRTNPSMVPFSELDPGTQDYDRQQVRLIPVLLAAVGYELYRMEAIDAFEDSRLVESMARLNHDGYLKDEQAKGRAAGRSLVAYDALDEDLKHSNRDSVALIPWKLALIGCVVVDAAACPAEMAAFSNQEIQKLARYEHDRWCMEKRIAGWRKRPEEDLAQKTTPYLVDYDELPAEVQHLDIDNVRRMPGLLGALGMVVVRSDEVG